MPEVKAIENADGQEKRTGEILELRDGVENFHCDLRAAFARYFRQRHHPSDDFLRICFANPVDRDGLGDVEPAGFNPP